MVGENYGKIRGCIFSTMFSPEFTYHTLFVFRMPIKVFHHCFHRQFLGFHQLRALLHLGCLYLDGVFALAARPPDPTPGPPDLNDSQAGIKEDKRSPQNPIDTNKSSK